MSVNPQQNYPTVARVMNRARAFVNDAYQKGAGRILTNRAPFTVEYLNSALEELQDKIGNNGVITLIRDNVIVGPIPALPAANPAVQIKLTYNGLFNGVTMQETPVLPADVRQIYVVSERQVGSNLPFREMQQPQEGLPSGYQTNRLGVWEYREDAICMTGSLIVEELRLRYLAQLPIIGPSIETEADDSWNTTQIAILSSVNALAKIVAYNYGLARRGADPNTAAMQTDAEKFMRYIVRRYTRGKQHRRFRRRPYGNQNLSLSRPRPGLPY